jgi:predicted transcriptional regulator
VFTYIRDNPGASTNRVITALGLNPAIARKCLASLMNHGVIEDKIVGGNHAYSVRGRL